MYIRFSNLLLMAESSTHGIFVAPRTRIPSLSTPTPCICTRNSVLIRLADSLSLSLRDEHNESTSSINIMEGLCSRAIWKSVFTSLSDSPSHLETKSDDDTEKNVELFA